MNYVVRCSSSPILSPRALDTKVGSYRVAGLGFEFLTTDLDFCHGSEGLPNSCGCQEHS